MPRLHYQVPVEQGSAREISRDSRTFKSTLSMRLCPDCGNMLLVEKSDQLRFYCYSCPYTFNVEDSFVITHKLQRKKVDDILGGPESWRNAEQTAGTLSSPPYSVILTHMIEQCPKCYHPKAFFKQMQTRSADEPMTIFYQCCNFDCAHRWKD